MTRTEDGARDSESRKDELCEGHCESMNQRESCDQGQRVCFASFAARED